MRLPASAASNADTNEQKPFSCSYKVRTTYSPLQERLYLCWWILASRERKLTLHGRRAGNLEGRKIRKRSVKWGANFLSLFWELPKIRCFPLCLGREYCTVCLLFRINSIRLDAGICHIFSRLSSLPWGCLMGFGRYRLHRQLGLLPVLFFSIAAAVVFTSATVNAQYVQQAVGGISIKSDGLIENASVDTLDKLRAERARLIKKPGRPQCGRFAPQGLAPRTGRSHRGALKSGKPLPEEVFFLAGLQDIRYVFVYPEQKDIVLVGFGEGWRIDTRGNVVGITTGKPVLLLDDLLTALRTAATSAQAGISCSIDPTQEGIQQLRAQVATLTTMNNKKAVAPAWKRRWAGSTSLSAACRRRATLPAYWWRPTIA